MGLLNGLPLPPAKMRIGGVGNKDDRRFMRIGIGHARRLIDRCGLTSASSVLDIGCGQARLLYGIIHELGTLRQYVGMDVHAPSIEWLVQHLNPHVPYASFRHIPYANARYNPSGRKALDVETPGQFDCIALLSVFSHMWLADIETYLPFVAGALAPDGRIFITLFVEHDEPRETENPANYLKDWSGPMHCVRLNRGAFEQLVADADLSIRDFRYRDIGKVQSSYVLTPATS